MSVEVDAELNSIDDLLPGPSRNAEVGDERHDWHGEKPEGDKRDESVAPTPSPYRSGVSARTRPEARRAP